MLAFNQSSTNARRRAVPARLVGLALTMGTGSLPFSRWDHEFADTRHLLGHEAIYWALAALVLLNVRLFERRPLSSIGFHRFGLREVLFALATVAATLAGFAFIYFLIFPSFGISEASSVNPLASAPGWWLGISVIRAGVSEELLFRGYPIERLMEWTGRRVVAFGIPLIVFSLAHLASWGWSHVLVAAFGGAMLTALYAWCGNLWVNILAHCLIDGLALA